ncbi:hypothetical protein ERJ75_001040100 [Trypanosoma vivax]|nr:hypothetical protein TRVL_01262 [Trypanosoma vivax]KAH8611043.1 hypothetical protein ERJ75_001040100 [Trypanosoma vivax]
MEMRVLCATLALLATAIHCAGAEDKCSSITLVGESASSIDRECELSAMHIEGICELNTYFDSLIPYVDKLINETTGNLDEGREAVKKAGEKVTDIDAAAGRAKVKASARGTDVARGVGEVVDKVVASVRKMVENARTSVHDAGKEFELMTGSGAEAKAAVGVLTGMASEIEQLQSKIRSANGGGLSDYASKCGSGSQVKVSPALLRVALYDIQQIGSSNVEDRGKLWKGEVQAIYVASLKVLQQMVLLDISRDLARETKQTTTTLLPFVDKALFVLRTPLADLQTKASDLIEEIENATVDGNVTTRMAAKGITFRSMDVDENGEADHAGKPTQVARLFPVVAGIASSLFCIY